MFFAQIGPTGGDNGYSAITNHVGWGISWWVGSITVRRQDLKVAKKERMEYLEEYLKNPQVHKWPSDSGDLRCSRQDLYFCCGGRG